MRRTKVERLAEELRDIWLGGQKGGRGDPTWSGSACKLSWIALAKDVLKRERRARGRTVARAWFVMNKGKPYVIRPVMKGDMPFFAAYPDCPARRGGGHIVSSELCRVVLVPRARKGGAR